MKNQMVKERVMDELVKTSTMNELMVDSAPIAKKSIKKLCNHTNKGSHGVRGPILSGFRSGAGGPAKRGWWKNPTWNPTPSQKSTTPFPLDPLLGRAETFLFASPGSEPNSAQNPSPDTSQGPSDAVFHPGFVFEGPGARKRPPEAENNEKPKS